MYSQNVLPFSAEQLDTSTFMEGLPGSAQPFQINGFPSTVATLCGPLQGCMRWVIQNNAKRNRLRIFSYNQLSRCNFMNDDWCNLIITAGEILEYYMSIGQINETNVQHMLPKIADDVIAISASRNVIKFPALLNCISQQEADAAQQCINLSAQIDQQITAMQQRRSMGNFYNNNQMQVQRPMAGYGQQMNGGMSPALTQQQSSTVNSRVTDQSVGVDYTQGRRGALGYTQAPVVDDTPVGERRPLVRNKNLSAKPQSPKATLPGGIMEESTPSGTITSVISQIPEFPDIPGIDITSTENNMEAMAYGTLEADPVQRARALAASDSIADDGMVIPLRNLKPVIVETTGEEGDDPIAAPEQVKLDKFNIIVIDNIKECTPAILPLGLLQEVSDTAGDRYTQDDIDNAQIMVRANLELSMSTRIPDTEVVNVTMLKYNDFIRGMTDIQQLINIPDIVNPGTVPPFVSRLIYKRLKLEINNILHNSLMLPEDKCIDLFPEDIGEMLNWMSKNQPEFLVFLNQNIGLVKNKLLVTKDKAVVYLEGGNYTTSCLKTYEATNCISTALYIEDFDKVIYTGYYQGSPTQRYTQMTLNGSEAPFFFNMAHRLIERAKKLGWENTRWRIYLASGQCIMFEKPWVTDKPTRMKVWVS